MKKKRVGIDKKRKNYHKFYWVIGITVMIVVGVYVFSFTFSKKDTMTLRQKQEHAQMTDSDADALINNFADVDFNFTTIPPTGTSVQGDSKFKDAGSDLKNFYLIKKGNTIYLKLTLYDVLNDELAYEFYIKSSNETYQLRIIPYIRIYLWKHATGGPQPYHRTNGLKIETRENYIEIEFPKELFNLRDSVRVSAEVFNIKLFNQTGDSFVSHDSVQFKQEFRIKIT